MKKQKDSRVCVIGLGYIGLPTAALIATNGYRVLGVDINRKVVEVVSRGDVHINEPDLYALVNEAVKSGSLKVDIAPAEADVFIIAVPTPFKEHAGEIKYPDLSYVQSAVNSILPHIRKGGLVILESTSPVGTTEEIIVSTLAKSGLKIGEEVFVAYCPERVLPGQILKELIMNDRVVGGVNRASTQAAKAFYSNFIKGAIHSTDSKTAELVKLVENSYRDVNIAFANEISIIADKIGINVWRLIELVNKHPRVNVLKPGPGVGGHCIAVDPWFIISQYEKESRLLKAARDVNENKADYVIEQIIAYIKINKIKRVGCLGLTYKENVNDLRESPALKIVKKLISAKMVEVTACDPNIDEKEYNGIKLGNLKATVEWSDLVIILVAHKEFLGLKLGDKKVLDFKGLEPKVN